VCLEQLHSSIVFPPPLLLLPSFNSVWWVHYAILICIYAACFNPHHPSVSFPFSPSTDAPQKVPHIHSCLIIIIILGLGPTNEQENAIFGLLSLVYLTQYDDLQFHPFSCKWHQFIFLYS
jgi:hypothetical protein